MIKTGLYRVAFLAALYAVFYFCMDPALRWAAVKGGEATFGAKVEIAKLRAGLFPPSVELTGVAVADASAPMKNLIEFERAAFALEGRALLEKSFIVREASVTGIRLQSDRRTSGALPPPRSEEPPPRPGLVDKVKTQTSGFTLEKVAEAKTGAGSYQIKKEDLESFKLAEQLKDRYQAKLDDWEKRWKQAGFDERTDKLKAAFQEAQDEKDNLKKVKKFNAVLKESKKLSDEAKKFQAEFKEDLAKSKEDLKAVQDAKKRDTDAVMSKLKLPALDAESISRFLLGPEWSAKTAQALDWIAWARRMMPPSQPTPAPPQRGKGATISFARALAYPSWALREAKLTGWLPLEAGRQLAFEGKLTGVTSQPALLGVPARLEAKGSADGGKVSASLSATLDHRKEPISDKVEFSYSGIPMGAQALGNQESVALKVGPGTAGVDGKLALLGDGLDGRMTFSERGVSISPEVGPKGGGDYAKKIMGAAFQGVDRFEAEVGMKGTLKDPDWKVTSSLGRQLSEGFKKALGGEIEARRKEVEAKIQSLVGDRVDQIQKDAEGKQGKLLGKLGDKADSAKDLDKKVQDAIDKAQKSILDPGKIKAPKSLKKLFK